MSTIAIGDIHGNFRALDDLLDKITPAVFPADTIVFLGDYIDRGPASKDCIDRILDFQNKVRAKIVALLGNHEQWFLRTYKNYSKHSWLLGMEAFETIRSYSPAAEKELRQEIENTGGIGIILDHIPLRYDRFFKIIPKEHIDFFKSLKTFHKTSDAICVHGGLNPAVARLEDQDPDDLIWGTDDFPDQYTSQDIVLYGHKGNPLMDKEGWPSPRIVNRTYGLDTIHTGILTALKLPEKIVIQSDRFK